MEKRMGWGWGVVSRRRCRAGRRSGRSSGRMGIVCGSSGAPVYAVALSGVAGSVCGCEWAGVVSWSDVVCGEWVVNSSAFAADVAVGCCGSDDLCVASILCVIESIVMLLTVFASSSACSECAAV